MRSFLKYLSIRIILIIITLHAVVPHPHSDELSADKHIEIHQQTNSFIGIISLVFHENNDENLDNLFYKEYPDLGKVHVKDQTSKIFALHVLALNAEAIANERSVGVVTSYVSNTSFFVRLNGLRGPPSVT